jgi:hypothetical protein
VDCCEAGTAEDCGGKVVSSVMYFYVAEGNPDVADVRGRSLDVSSGRDPTTHNFSLPNTDDAPENRQNAAQAVVPCFTCRRAAALVVTGTAEHEPG